MYVHGYGAMEERRLRDQALSLADLLHGDTRFPAGSRIIEVGCGTGAQTVILAQNSPGADITSVDISATSLAVAAKRLDEAGVSNVRLRQADIFDLPFQSGSFDHLFVCFVLEHLPEPEKALAHLKRLLRPGGTITLIEGDHGSTFFHPESSEAHRAIGCQIELQRRAGGDALIGRRLYPILKAEGFQDVRVSPRLVYVDESRPTLVEGFIRNTFTAMVRGVREAAVAEALIDADSFDQGIRDLYRTAEPGGVFCYTFFKAWGSV